MLLLIRGRFSVLDTDRAWIRSRHACLSLANGGALGCSNYVLAVALVPVSAFQEGSLTVGGVLPPNAGDLSWTGTCL